MDIEAVLNWLQNEKKMSVRSSRDVVSRLRRVSKILGVEKLDHCREKDLCNSEGYQDCSTFVKAQLCRALTLYLEFLKK